MGWSIGYDSNWKRDIGYGVPAFCDHPRCKAEIDRGLSYVCGGEEFGGARGCGLYFCGEHLSGGWGAGVVSLCSRCRHHKKPFVAKPEHPRWIKHKLTDESWTTWRAENPNDVLELQALSDVAPLCGCGCGKPRDRKGQRYRRECHAAYMRAWRTRQSTAQGRYAESVARLRAELDAFHAEATKEHTS